MYYVVVGKGLVTVSEWQLFLADVGEHQQRKNHINPHSDKLQKEAASPNCHAVSISLKMNNSFIHQSTPYPLPLLANVGVLHQHLQSKPNIRSIFDENGLSIFTTLSAVLHRYNTKLEASATARQIQRHHHRQPCLFSVIKMDTGVRFCNNEQPHTYNMAIDEQ